MFNSEKSRLAGLLRTAGLIGGAIDPAAANMSLGGQVQAGGGSVAELDRDVMGRRRGRP